MRLQYSNVNRLWNGLLSQLLMAPEVAPRGKRVREITGVTLVLEDARANVLTNAVRAPNYRFMVAEWLWIWFGRRDVDSIARYNSKIAAFSDDGRTFHGAYGPRIGTQWERVARKLRSDRDSRQAVITIFNDTDVAHVTRDVPCTLSFQFMIRRDRLEMIATMRSSDVWLGLPYDIFNFTQLQASMAAQLEVETGKFIVNLGSSHLYAEHFKLGFEALEVLEADPSTHVRSPRFYDAPSTLLDDVLFGGETSPDRDPWQTYARVLRATRSADALEILREIGA